MTRKGRKRTTTRTRSGRAAAPPMELVPKEIEERRRKLLGDFDKHSTVWRRDPRLADTLGHMFLRKQITERQYRAGQAVARIWHAWAVLAECPERHASAANLPIATDAEREPLTPFEIDMLIAQQLHDPDRVLRWRRLSEAMEGIRDAVRSVLHHQLAWSLLDTVCADDVMPPRLEQSGPLADKCWRALRDALDAAAGVFKIPAEKEAA